MICAICLGTAALSAAARAQGASGEVPGGAGKNRERKISLEGGLGFSNFPDESSQYHIVAGGTARFRLFRGLGLMPEFTYMYRSRQDRDFLLLPNVIWEFRRDRRIVPYVVAGAGLLYHRETWDHASWSASAWIVAAGFGTRIFLTDRVFAAPEFRIGWEPHIRATFSIGYVLSR